MSENQPTLTKKVQMAQCQSELARLVSQGIRRHADLADLLGVSVMTVRRDLEELERIANEQGGDMKYKLRAIRNRSEAERSLASREDVTVTVEGTVED